MVCKVSVIMPSLNVQKYIRECLDSVVSQTLKEIEIICVDASSTDGTGDVISEYTKRDKRIVVLHSDIKSYGHQINLGLRYAHGEYIAIVETDDIAEKNMLEVLYGSAVKNKSDYAKGCARLLFDTKYGRIETGEIVPDPNLKDIDEDIVIPQNHPNLFYTDNFLWNGIYKREYLKGIPFRETRGAAFQDISVLFRIISRSKKAVYVRNNVYLYRQDNMSASSYNPNGLNFTNDEYEFIINNCLAGLNSEWKHICYKKLSALLLDRYDVMAIQGRYWVESENGISGIREKIEYADKSGILSNGSVNTPSFLRIQGFLKSPIVEFKEEEETIAAEKSAIKELVDFIKGKENIILFGAGAWGKKLYEFLLINGIKIREVWDNSNKLVGSSLGEAIIVNPHFHECGLGRTAFLVCSKKYGDEIRNQLINNGIDEECIYVTKNTISGKLLYYYRFYG